MEKELFSIKMAKKKKFFKYKSKSGIMVLKKYKHLNAAMYGIIDMKIILKKLILKIICKKF
jgi:hypothetical protein